MISSRAQALEKLQIKSVSILPPCGCMWYYSILTFKISPYFKVELPKGKAAVYAVRIYVCVDALIF